MHSMHTPNEVQKILAELRSVESAMHKAKKKEVRRQYDEDLLPVISFESKKDSETETKHNEFVKRMLARGYTQRQVRRLVEWYMRVNKAG